MTQSLADGFLPWDTVPAARSGPLNFNGYGLVDDAEAPTDPTMPSAGLLNNQSITCVGVGALIPNATISVRYATVPVVDSFVAMKGNSPGASPFYVGSQWIGTTTYVVSAYVVPTVGNGFYYKCTVAGTTSGTQPTWPVVIGTTVMDGTVTWTCWAASTGLLVIMRTPTGAGAGDVFIYWASGAMPTPVTRPKATLNGNAPAFAPSADWFTDANSNSGVRIVAKNTAGTATDLPFTVDVM